MKKKILIVEDEVAIAMDLEMNLEMLGYEVCGHAVSYDEAIALYSQTQPDLVLMDVNLYGNKSGIDVALWIKNQASTPIIFLTAFNDTTTFKKAIESEPYGYMVKPFTSDELRNHIEVAFKKAENTLDSKDYLTEIFDNYKAPVVALNSKNEPKFANKTYLESYRLGDFNWNEVELESSRINSLLNKDSMAIEAYELELPNFQKLIIFGSGNDSEWGDKKQNNFLFVKDKRKYSRVLFSDILWLEALDNYTSIHTKTGRFTLLGYLSDFEAKLDSNFLRIHRSYIVALPKVKTIEDHFVVFGDKKLPISKTKKADLLNRLQN